MSSGCAVVSTYVGGLSNIIIDGYNGLMVKPAAKDISEAINRLIDDKELREQLISGALETAKRFSLDVWKFRWTKILKDINWI